jgi:hypothetical protein
MDKALINALADLQRQKAKWLPTASEVANADNESHWSGKTADGRPWRLFKSAPESYQVDY